MGFDEAKPECWGVSKQEAAAIMRKFFDFAQQVIAEASGGRMRVVQWDDMVFNGVYALKNNVVQVWHGLDVLSDVITKTDSYAILSSLGSKVTDGIYLDCGFGLYLNGGPNSWCDPRKSWREIYDFTGDYFVIEDVCSHDGQPLTDGPLTDGSIACPRHGARFDLKSGDALCMPATKGIRTFQVEIRDGEIWAGLSSTSTADEQSDKIRYDVVGPICESSDCFGKAIELPKSKRGDLIAIHTAGAYGEVLSSSYNLRSKAKAYYYE